MWFIILYLYESIFQPITYYYKKLVRRVKFGQSIRNVKDSETNLQYVTYIDNNHNEYILLLKTPLIHKTLSIYYAEWIGKNNECTNVTLYLKQIAGIHKNFHCQKLKVSDLRIYFEYKIPNWNCAKNINGVLRVIDSNINEKIYKQSQLLKI